MQYGAQEKISGDEAMDCATIVKRGYLYDKKMGILPVTTVSDEREGERERERQTDRQTDR